MATFKKKKKRREDFVAPPWTSSRPKPNVDDILWDPEDVEEIARYIDWHGRHPHCNSPRVLTNNIEFNPDSKFVRDDDNPNLFYNKNTLKQVPFDKSFLPDPLGGNGKFNEASEVCAKAEYLKKVDVNFETDDPWYIMSVQDNLEISHIDGFHTSAQFKRPSRRTWKGINIEPQDPLVLLGECGYVPYDDYQGGSPTLKTKQRNQLDELAISNKGAWKKEKIKKSPWVQEHVYAIHTKDGTGLTEFKKVKLKSDIQQAWAIYEDEMGERKKTIADLGKQPSFADKMKGGFLSFLTNLNFSWATKLTSNLKSLLLQRHPIIAPAVDLVNHENSSGNDQIPINGNISNNNNAEELETRHIGNELEDIDEASDSQEMNEELDKEMEGDDSSWHSGVSSLTASVVRHFPTDKFVSSPLNSRDITNTSAFDFDANQSIVTPWQHLLEVSQQEQRVMDNEDLLVQAVDLHSVARSRRSVTAVEDQQSLMSSNIHSKSTTMLASPTMSQIGGRSKSIASMPSSSHLQGKGKSSKASLRSAFPSVGSTAISTAGSKQVSFDATATLGSSSVVAGSSVTSSVEVDHASQLSVLDPYEVMVKKLGGDAALEAMAEDLLQYTSKVRKSSNKQTGFIDLSLNLSDCCERGNVMKVGALLAAGSNPNCLVNDVPLFLHLMERVMKMDTQLNSLNIGDEEIEDRKRFQQVLKLLVKFGADINVTSDKHGMAAIHIAAIGGNAKVVSWLVSIGAKIDLLSNFERMSAFQYAGKFGHVNVLMVLIEAGCDVNEVDTQEHWTVLHYAAQFGQTKTAMFLLRVGAKKNIKDKVGRTAGALASENGYHATSQAIFTYNPPRPAKKPLLDYWQTGGKPPPEEVDLTKTMSKTLSTTMGSIEDALDAGVSMFTNFLRGRKMNKIDF